MPPTATADTGWHWRACWWAARSGEGAIVSWPPADVTWQISCKRRSLSRSANFVRPKAVSDSSYPALRTLSFSIDNGMAVASWAEKITSKTWVSVSQSIMKAGWLLSFVDTVGLPTWALRAFFPVSDKLQGTISLALVYPSKFRTDRAICTTWHSSPSTSPLKNGSALRNNSVAQPWRPLLKVKNRLLPLCKMVCRYRSKCSHMAGG
mmetsp:Transcript_49969/g.109198  ORF Transcript_49969/g.109198 Transcript_49969/m.109198 type:complete len:207 (-) Transcript_49969:301-921(-)